MTTCEPARSGGETEPPLTLFAADSLASQSRRQARSWPRPMSGGSGPRSQTLFAAYDPISSSWRTFQGSLFAEWETFSETWPRSGSMQSGRAYRQQPLVPRTYATECSSWAIGRPRLLDGPEVSGYWPTPRAVDNGQIITNRSDPRNAKTAPTLSEAARLWPTPRASQAGKTVRLYPGTVSGGSHARQANGGHGDLHEEVARHEMWPTPRAIDGRPKGNGPRPDTLTGAVTYDENGKRIMLPTPTANRWDGLQSHGVNVVTGQLNPAWVSTLMGYPPDWTELD